MQHIHDLQHPPIVGETYLVDCVYYNNQWLPLLGPSHDDLEVNVKTWHFHLDQRFISHELNDQLRSGCKDHFIHDHGPLFCTPKDEPEIKTLPMVCTRSDSERPFVVNELEQIYKGRNSINGRCPHKGAFLKNCTVKNGHVVCPMHGLMFNAETGEQVIRPFAGVPEEQYFDVKIGY